MQILEEIAVLLKMLLPGEEKITLGFKDADRLSTLQLQLNGLVLINSRFRAPSRRLIRA